MIYFEIIENQRIIVCLMLFFYFYFVFRDIHNAINQKRHKEDIKGSIISFSDLQRNF